MARFYLDPTRQSEKWAVTDAEVFFLTAEEAGQILPDDADASEGWFWHVCLPGCLPDSDPCGPFPTEADAVADARNFYPGD